MRVPASLVLAAILIWMPMSPVLGKSPAPSESDASGHAVELERSRATFAELWREHEHDWAMIRAHAERTGRRDAGIERWRELLATLDHAAGQYDAVWSGLYWHTSLDAAMEEASAQRKPILSLRLLGRLDEPASCANSRFFRAILYSDPRIAQLLRDKFILHWQSMRPAPRITVDFGDGRRIEQTITGNSVHLVLGSDGRVLDAIPGLYAPSRFIDRLKMAAGLVLRYQESSTEERAAVARAILTASIDTANQSRTRAGMRTLDIDTVAGARRPSNPLPQAREAGALALNKVLAERPMLRAMEINQTAELEIDPAINLWLSRAKSTGVEVRFDGQSLALIRAQLRGAIDWSDGREQEVIRTLSQATAADTALNELELRPRILELLRDPALACDATALTSRVYADVFLTPLSDPWLGLHAPEAFNGFWGGVAKAQP